MILFFAALVLLGYVCAYAAWLAFCLSGTRRGSGWTRVLSQCPRPRPRAPRPSCNTSCHRLPRRHRPGLDCQRHSAQRHSALRGTRHHPTACQQHHPCRLPRRHRRRSGCHRLHQSPSAARSPQSRRRQQCLVRSPQSRRRQQCLVRYQSRRRQQSCRGAATSNEGTLA